MPIFEQLCEEVGRCILRAGRAILDIYSTDFNVDEKSDSSPITEADRQAHTIIQEGLKDLSIPGYRNLPFLSEEGAHTPYGERRTWERYWLVDPLDGTKEFVGRNGEFTVNIALIENSSTRAGWVYVPVTDTLYFGDEDEGAFRVAPDGSADSKTAAGFHENKGFAARAASIPGGTDGRNSEKLRVVASRSHLSEDTKNYIDAVSRRFGKEVETVQAGSSLKLCRIAEGTADLYPRFGPTMEWDTAAAHAVCRAAGCSLIDIETGDEMKYNKENLLNPFFLAAPVDTIPPFIELARKLNL